MDKVGEKIFNLRKEKGVSQEKLAEALGVARFTVSRWENNVANPTTENIKSICEFFGVASTYFFDNGEESAAAEVKTEAVAQEPTAETVKEAEADKKEVKHKTLKIVSVVIGIILLLFLVIACSIAAYVSISPGSGGEWGKDIHIVNYAGIIFLVVGTVAVAVIITASVLLILKIIKRKKQQKLQN